MKIAEVERRLKSLGTAQNRKIYARHGVSGPAYGVSYANLGQLRREIGTDHELARALWKSGNHDARVVAMMIVDPTRLTASNLEAWARDLDSYPLTDAFVGMAAQSSLARAKMKRWMGSRKEWLGSAGWGLFVHLCERDGLLTDTFLAETLGRIEAQIHSAPNRVRYSMNTALIQIGCRNASLRRSAVAAARRIGTVEIDHGETGCKTPAAEAYIAKVMAQRASSRRKKA